MKKPQFHGGSRQRRTLVPEETPLAKGYVAQVNVRGGRHGLERKGETLMSRDTHSVHPSKDSKERKPVSGATGSDR